MDSLSTRYYEWAVNAKREYVASLSRASTIQTELLAEIVSRNQESAFGREHRFKSIRAIRDYEVHVPIRTYAELAPWIERAANGETDALTADAPIVYHRTSSTTGAPKKIPMTGPGLVRRSRNAGCHAASLLEKHPELLASTDAALVLTVNPPVAEVTPSGVPWCFVSETDWDALNARRHPGGPGARAPWARAVSSGRDFHYRRIRLSAERSLRGILSWFPASIIQLRHMLIEHAASIVAEVRDGLVEGQRVSEPNPRRAAALERAFARGEQMVLQDVWPELAVVQCWRGATSELYVPHLRQSVGHEVALASAGYAATESPIALPLAAADTAYLLDVTCAYFEFRPVHAGDHVVLHQDDLERDKDYVVILTTMSGLFRYNLQDVVRVIDHVDNVPLLQFRHRDEVVSSLVAEKFTEPQIVGAVSTALRDARYPMCEWTLVPIYGGTPHYRLLVETPQTIDVTVTDALGRLFDTNLASNINYGLYRSSGLVAPAQVHMVAPGTFAAWRRGQQLARGAALPQQKHPVVVAASDADELGRISERLRTGAAPWGA